VPAAPREAAKCIQCQWPQCRTRSQHQCFWSCQNGSGDREQGQADLPRRIQRTTGGSPRSTSPLATRGNGGFKEQPRMGATCLDERGWRHLHERNQSHLLASFVCDISSERDQYSLPSLHRAQISRNSSVATPKRARAGFLKRTAQRSEECCTDRVRTNRPCAAGKDYSCGLIVACDEANGRCL
jgi:hypothetical protein